MCLFSFFFNDTAPTEIYTLSLHDALPIFRVRSKCGRTVRALTSRTKRRTVVTTITFANATRNDKPATPVNSAIWISGQRSEEHTSELQSRRDLVCRLLLEKKK